MTKRNQAAVNRLLHSPGGAVGRDLVRRGERVLGRAKALCPVYFGYLRSQQVRTEPQPIAEGLLLQVGSNVPYSLAVHEGSGSPYAPRSWRIAHARGHAVRPRRYLTNALPAARGN